jgi:hypothetical protein
VADGVHDPQRAAAQRGFEKDAAGTRELAALTEHIRVVERRREMADRVFARAHQRDPPAGAGLHHQPAVQRGNQPGADQGRLAAAGGADDRQEPM